MFWELQSGSNGFAIVDYPTCNPIYSNKNDKSFKNEF